MDVRGVDLSHYNNDVDFHTLKAVGIQFVALKATQGALYTDPTFIDRRNRVDEVGFSQVLLYHFIDPHDDATAQAQHFASVVRSLGPNELLAFDVEGDAWVGISPEESARIVINVIAETKGAIGAVDHECFIYGSPGWLRGQFGDSLKDLTNWPLWAARYGPELGDVSPWVEAIIWQNYDRASVAGAGTGDVDTDLWIGPWSQ